MASKTVRIVYWISTVLFALALGWSAVQYLTGDPKMMATMSHLGYPLYFVKGLGIAKLGGILALFFGASRFKEWAYAGFTFNLAGATVSHLASGDGVLVAAVPVAFFALLAVSYLTHRRIENEAPFAPRGTPGKAETAIPAFVSWL